MSLQVWLPLNKNNNLHNQGLTNLTFSNYGAVPSTDGKIGSYSYSFSSQGNNPGYIISDSVINSIDNSKLSIAFWANFDKVYEDTSILYHPLINIRPDNSATAFITLAQVNGNLVVMTRSPNNQSNTYSVLSSITSYLKSWHHFVIIYDDSIHKVKIYIDGEKVNERDKYVISASNLRISLGKVNYSYNTYSYWDGKLNDVRIYNHCLSPKEVEELAKGLILHWQLKGEQANWLLPNTITELARKSSSNSWVDFSYNQDLISCSEENYIVDFWGKGSASDMKIDIYFRDSSGNATSITNQQILTTDWRHYSLPLNGSPSNLVLFRVRCYKGTAGDVISISNMRLLSNNTPIQIDKIHDCSGYLYDGEITGNLSVFPHSPKYDSSIYFNGSSGITTNNFSLTGCTQLSVSAWIKYSGDFGNPIIFKDNTNFKFRFYNKRIYFRKTDDSEYVTFGTMEANQWYHLVAVYSNNQVTTYKNGEEVATGGTSSDNLLPLQDSTSLYIGKYTNNYTFTGQISDVRVYSTALNAAAVKELYQTSAQIDSSGNLYTRELIEQ